MIGFPRLGHAGRLGNQLWQIAATIGIAEQAGESCSFPAWDYQPYFSVPVELFTGGGGRDAGEIPERIDPRARVYLQDWNLFSHIESQIKDFFKPSPAAVERLSKSPIWAMDVPTVAVHVRRGDNLRELTSHNGFHPLKGPDYYAHALEYVPLSAVAVIFTDDPQWCQDVLVPTLDRDVILSGGVPRPETHDGYWDVKIPLDWVDLQLMARCDFHVISNSTFSWWGAYLSHNRRSIYPWPWFGPKLDYIDATLMFPPDWIPVRYRIDYRG